MSRPVYFVLVGPPGAGKSTLAAQLQNDFPTYLIISTDQIREQLFGDASIQGPWELVEAETLSQIQEAHAQGHPIIYDATNVKTGWRLAFLAQVKHLPVEWVALHLTTPLQDCQKWNLERERQVPPEVIEKMHQQLKDFPPEPAEGWTTVIQLTPTQGTFDLTPLHKALKKLPRSRTNRVNRSKQYKYHRWSRLVDFNRLLHLITLILNNPGAKIENICQLLCQEYGSIYAQPAAVEVDLQWLQTYGFADSSYQEVKYLRLPELINSELEIFPHAYSDKEAFRRIMLVIRFILYHSFKQQQGGSLLSVATEVQKAMDSIRRDIGDYLKPHQILLPIKLSEGYFIGTSIFTDSELGRIFQIMQSFCKNLSNPLALETEKLFEERMQLYGKSVDNPYPVRAIRNRLMINTAWLDESSLAREENLRDLEDSIERGNQITLIRLSNPRFSSDRPSLKVWPLQLVFFNSAWYLGYEAVDGLFGFDRLDRLSATIGHPRSKQEHQQALEQFIYLYESSFGVYLGSSTQDQKVWLSKDTKMCKSIEVQVELRFTDYLYQFIIEGTQRLPRMKLSPPQNQDPGLLQSGLIQLKAGDGNYPNRLTFVIPRWSLQDVELQRWILSYGNQVRVYAPSFLVKNIEKQTQFGN